MYLRDRVSCLYLVLENVSDFFCSVVLEVLTETICEVIFFFILYFKF